MFVGSIVLGVCLLQAEPPSLRVLSDTGQRRDGFPAVERHPDPRPYIDALTRGYSGRLLRLYQLEQRFVRPGQPTQPGILVLSDNDGGFPRWGLYENGARPQTAYVDLQRRMRAAGWRATDQIFPHELLHIIVHDLAGEPPTGHATQIHAAGVKTDRITAFNEGFAEHAQVMALDDADAPPETRVAAASPSLQRDIGERPFERYRRSLAARLYLVPKAQITFPVWYSNGEQAQRYYAVRENLFAREPDLPARLFTISNAYDAYLLENAMTGSISGRPKPVGRLLSTEGVVATLFHRIVTNAAVQRADRDAAFYARFGTTRDEIDPLMNAYLKVFVAIRQGGYDTLRVVKAYQRLFPEERGTIDAIVHDVFLGQPAIAPAELWVLNDAVRIGTSLFDQYRGIPRPPAFDLNAASRADLIAVPGVDLALAERIIQASPFASIDDLRRIDGMPAAVTARFQDMRRAIENPPTAGTEEEENLSFRAVLMPYVWRALAAWGICAAIGAVLYRQVRKLRVWRLTVNGIAAAIVALLVGWTLDPGFGLVALAAPVACFGLPGALIRGVRTRSPREAALVLGAWVAAGAAAAVAVTPLG